MHEITLDKRFELEVQKKLIMFFIVIIKKTLRLALVKDSKIKRTEDMK